MSTPDTTAPWLIRWTYRTGEVRFLVKQDGRFYWSNDRALAARFASEDEALDFIDERVAEGSPVDAIQESA